MRRKEIPEMNKGRVIYLSLVTVLSLIGLLLCWVALSCVSSLQKVIEEGGSGFEMKNYKQIRAEKTGARHGNDYSSDDDV